MIPLVEAQALRVDYPIRKGVLRRQVGAVRAVDGVDLAIAPGRTFGLVGESGCGKSTLSRALLRLQDAAGGRVIFDDREGGPTDLLGLAARPLRRLRRQMQIVFQDPYSALNPRLRVGTALAEPLRALEGTTGAAARARIAEVLEAVGLPASAATRFPHEFSGGQRQRVAIARALVTRPRFLVLDEPVSALDVSVRAQVLNLLVEMQRALGLTYLFVSHDLSVVRYLCDEVAVMYLGRVVEQAPAARLFAAPRHPYTRVLLASVPVPRPGARQRGERPQGEPPSPLAPPPGCAFHARCPAATAICRQDRPELTGADGHLAACHHA